MEKFLFSQGEINGGVQKVYKFDNGYGASVVRHRYSYGYTYGLWEMALLKFITKEDGQLTWRIVYREDFANWDVAGYLNDDQVLSLLEWIKNL